VIGLVYAGDVGDSGKGSEGEVGLVSGVCLFFIVEEMGHYIE